MRTNGPRDELTVEESLQEGLVGEGIIVGVSRDGREGLKDVPWTVYK